MQTQKTLVALAALALTAGLAHADISIVSNDKGSLAMYGIADMALGSQQYSLNADPLNPSSIVTTSATKATVTSGASGVFNGGLSGSRLGFKGNLDVGDGIKAFFVAEAGIQLPNFQLANAGAALASNSPTATTSASNSSLNGQLFSRQANIGLSDATLGSLAFGRNYAPIYDVATQYDSIQASQLFSPLGGGTVGGGGGVSEDTRVDNSLRYMNKFSGVNTTVLYKVSTGASNGTAPATAFGLNVGYEAADWGVQVAYQAFTDAIKGAAGATAGTVGITAYNTTAYMIAGKYKVTPDVTIKGGYESYTLSAPNDNLVTAAVYNYYGQNGVAAAPYTDNQVTNVAWLGADYNLTSKLNLAASYYVQTPQASNLHPTTTAATNTYVSFLADYHQTKDLDAYLGVMASNFSGDLYNTAAYNTTNSVYAVGVRYKF